MEKEIKPEISDSMRPGVYANFFGVSASPEAVVIDFGNLLPNPGATATEKNIIVSRIITSRDGAKKLAELINGIVKDA
jgi:hypothetical protein